MNEERLHIMYDNLMATEWAGREWDFNVYNGGSNSEENKCGSLGCAIGEAPMIWSEWEYDLHGAPYVIGCEEVRSIINAAEWFDISWQAATHLFTPRSQDTDVYGGERLTSSATRKEVATNLRIFMKREFKCQNSTQ